MKLPKKLIMNVEDPMICREPETFNDAWNHQDQYQRNKWRIAINKEYGGDMRTRRKLKE